MKNHIIMAITFLLLLPIYINAQEYEDFYVKFELLSSEEKDGLIFSQIKIDDDLYQRIKIGSYADDLGHVMPIYDSGKKNTYELRGKALQLQDNKWEIQLKNTAENQALTKNNEGLLRINAKLEDIEEKHIIYDIFRLGIGMTDIYGEKDFVQWILSENVYSSTETFILKSLVEEAGFVAGEMKKQMASPDVEEGRFEGMDLFHAMESANDNDVRSFLRYVKNRPFKYQGTDWKFSEIFATWIVEGSPSSMEDLKDLASASWEEDTYFLKYFKDVDPRMTKKISEYLRTEAGHAIDDDNFEVAGLLAKNALILAKELDDPLEIAWSKHKQAKVFSAKGDHEEAIPLFEYSLAYFNQENVKVGILLAGNDAADNYNLLGGKSNYKKAIGLLEASIEQAEDFGKKDKTISPVTALMYRNMGQSYEGLEKYKKALEYYKIGLEYTDFSTPAALKRKATLELYISEVYRLMGEMQLADQYSNQAVVSYKEYEAALAAVRKL